MELGLAGRTVIVTGGGANIGRAIVLAFVREGANVVIADKSPEDAQKVADKANSLGKGRAIGVETDVTKLDEVEAMVRKALGAFKKLDVLINNTGAVVKSGYFLEIPPELWTQIIAINYVSVLNCFKAVLPYMIEQRSGAIVSISSDAALRGQVEQAIYAGCKNAVIAFSKSLAKEVGQLGIRINIVCPGFTPPSNSEEIGRHSVWKQPRFTPEHLEKMAIAHPLGKIGSPTEIAEAVVFFASEVTASHITGQALSIDGGYSISADLFWPSGMPPEIKHT
jgi:NAD(P)-dependent dehydrogenase (short-subunit alcohol dehydrogenase family)